MSALDQFRKRVVRDSLFRPCGLGEAVERLGFVQADPIRCPARAQDLILRHRVKNYSAVDLERRYPDLPLEECFLYAYGFMPRDLWRVIHPASEKPLTAAQKKTLEWFERHGPMHSRTLESHVGGERIQNYWGGFSRSAKLAMESLHDIGVLRVARRENGIRIYEVADRFDQPLTKEARFQEIIVATLSAMGATTRRFLMSELSHFDHLVKGPDMRRKCLQELISANRIRIDLVDSVEYVSLDRKGCADRKSDVVRILAPFDPIVRDRARFKHLWNWTYRFEAYTPKARRKLGYYAMPVLWREHIVGWTNAKMEGHRLRACFGYAIKRPDEKAYRDAAELEVVRLAKFLGLGESDWEALI